MKTIANIIHNTYFPIRIRDDQANVLYCETSTGFWWKAEYDKGNRIYHEDSDGFWTKCEFDDQGNEIYYENANGYVVQKP